MSKIINGPKEEVVKSALDRFVEYHRGIKPASRLTPNASKIQPSQDREEKNSGPREEDIIGSDDFIMDEIIPQKNKIKPSKKGSKIYPAKEVFEETLEVSIPYQEEESEEKYSSADHELIFAEYDSLIEEANSKLNYSTKEQEDVLVEIESKINNHLFDEHEALIKHLSADIAKKVVDSLNPKKFNNYPNLLESVNNLLSEKLETFSTNFHPSYKRLFLEQLNSDNGFELEVVNQIAKSLISHKIITTTSRGDIEVTNSNRSYPRLFLNSLDSFFSSIWVDRVSPQIIDIEIPSEMISEDYDSQQSPLMAPRISDSDSSKGTPKGDASKKSAGQNRDVSPLISNNSNTTSKNHF